MDTMDPMEAMQQSQGPMEKKRSKKWLVLLLFIIIVVLIVLGVYYGYKARTVSVGGEGVYNAVFLSNGQVYFGKLDKITKTDMVLTNVYYLQLQQPLQQGEEGSEDQKADISLVKLGNELHGPEDEMIINRDSVLFTEKLRGDSKVVEAIKENQ